MSAIDDLNRALANLAEWEMPPPCVGSSSWVSEDHDERAMAARLCLTSCPIVPECHAAAEAAGERFGVWAGVDRSNKPTRTKTTKKENPHGADA